MKTQCSQKNIINKIKFILEKSKWKEENIPAETNQKEAEAATLISDRADSMQGELSGIKRGIT